MIVPQTSKTAISVEKNTTRNVTGGGGGGGGGGVGVGGLERPASSPSLSVTRTKSLTNLKKEKKNDDSRDSFVVNTIFSKISDYSNKITSIIIGNSSDSAETNSGLDKDEDANAVLNLHEEYNIGALFKTTSSTKKNVGLSAVPSSELISMRRSAIDEYIASHSSNIWYATTARAGWIVSMLFLILVVGILTIIDTAYGGKLVSPSSYYLTGGVASIVSFLFIFFTLWWWHRYLSMKIPSDCMILFIISFCDFISSLSLMATSTRKDAQSLSCSFNALFFYFFFALSVFLHFSSALEYVIKALWLSHDTHTHLTLFNLFSGG